MNKQHKIQRSVLGVLLVAYISGIFILNMMTPNKVFSESENRKLEQAPEVTFKKIMANKFTASYEKYISDQFVLRDLWVGVKSDTDLAMGKKDNNDVYVGKNGFLMQRFNKPDMEIFNKNIEAINSFAEATPQLNKYFMLVPNSSKILEEKLPPYAYTEDQLVYIDKVKKALSSDIKFSNIYEELNSKKEEYIFYKTDHHWTTTGAYYAYEKLSKDMGIEAHDKSYFQIEKVTDSFYGSLYSKGGFRNVEPDRIELYIPKTEESYSVEYYDTNKKTKSLYERDNLNKKDKYTVFFDGNHPLIKISTNTNNGKKLLVVKDSFANSFIPFLTAHYSEIYVVDLRYYNESLSSIVKENAVNDMLMLYNVNTFFEEDSINSICW